MTPINPAPQGVLLPQGAGLLGEFRWGGRAARPAAVVGGRRVAGETGLAEEVAGSARGQVEAPGQGRGVVALLAGAEQGLPDG